MKIFVNADSFNETAIQTKNDLIEICLKYDIEKDKIEINIDKIKLICNKIKECDIREYYSWEEITKCFLDNVQFNSMDTMCFATSNDNPSIYIVCDEIKYSVK